MTPQKFQIMNATLLPLMFALGAFVPTLENDNENEDTIEFFDEAWILMKSAEGKAVIKNMRRIDALKIIPWHWLHNLYMMQKMTMIRLDLGPFCFLWKIWTRRYPKTVNLEVTESNLEWIDNMISGQCLYYDVYGNLNMISVHNIFWRYWYASKTYESYGVIKPSKINTLVRGEPDARAFAKLRGVDIFSLKSYMEPTRFGSFNGAWVLINELFVNLFFFILNAVVASFLSSFEFLKRLDLYCHL